MSLSPHLVKPQPQKKLRRKNLHLRKKSDPLAEGPAGEKPKILKFPIPKRSEAIIREINPDDIYTLTEAAEVTHIPRGRFRSMFRPGLAKWSQFERSNDPKNGQVLIKGSVLVTVVEYFDSIPADLIPLTRLSELVGLHPQNVRREVRKHEGSLIFPYILPDKSAILIPVYLMPDSRVYSIDARSFAEIEKLQKARKGRMNWESVRRHLIKKGIDVYDYELTTLNHFLHREGQKVFFKYPLFSGEIFSMEAGLIGAKTRRTELTFAREDVERFADALIQQNKKWMPRQDFIALLGGEQNFSSAYKGFSFSLDGKSYCLNFVELGNRVYLEREAAGAYLAWRQFKRSKEYVCLEPLYRMAHPESKGRRKEGMASARSEVDGKDCLVVCPTYGIAVQVRKYETVEKIHRTNRPLVQFYLTLKTSNQGNICIALNRLKDKLKAQAKSGGLNFESEIKLAILRDHYTHISRDDPGALYIDLLFTELVPRRFHSRLYTRPTAKKKGHFEKSTFVDLIELDLESMAERYRNRPELVFFKPVSELDEPISPYGDSPLALAQESVEGNARF